MKLHSQIFSHQIICFIMGRECLTIHESYLLEKNYRLIIYVKNCYLTIWYCLHTNFGGRNFRKQLKSSSLLSTLVLHKHCDCFKKLKNFKDLIFFERQITNKNFVPPKLYLYGISHVEICVVTL